MQPKATLLPLLLTAGLLLAGCADGASPDGDGPTDGGSATASPSQEPSATGSASPDPTMASTQSRPDGEDDDAGDGGTDEAPAPGPAPAPEQPAPGGTTDPLAAFTSTPVGAQYAGAVTGIVQEQRGGGLVHELTTNLYDPGVAVGLCEAYRSAMGTGAQQVDVLDALGQPLATTAGSAQGCAVAAGAPAPPGAVPQQGFTYDEALAAWRGGMPYYDAFCLQYTPVTEAGVSQCRGIEAGTVDAVTGEYTGG